LPPHRQKFSHSPKNSIFHQQNFDFTENSVFHRKNFAPHRQHYSFPENKSFSKKNLSFPRFWQNKNIGFSSFLKTEMIKLMILVFVSYSIAIMLLEHFHSIHGKRNTTYKANCAYSAFGNISIGETQNVTEN